MVKKGARPFKIVGSEESFQEIGIPDLLACYYGRFIGAEVKQPGASLRPAQRVILHEIYEADGVAAVLETVEQAKELLLYISRRRHDASAVCYDRGVFRRGGCHFRS